MILRQFENILILLIILAGLAASGTWLWTEWTHRRETILVERLLTGKPLTPGGLSRTMEEFPAPDHEILPGNHLFYASTLAVAAADMPDLPQAVRLKWLQQAQNALPHALAREPAHAKAWAYLAYIEWLLAGPNQQSVEALRLSIYASPADKQILLWRLKMADWNKEFWDDDFRGLLQRQAAIARPHF